MSCSIAFKYGSKKNTIDSETTEYVTKSRDKVIISEVHGFRLVFVLHLPVVLNYVYYSES